MCLLTPLLVKRAVQDFKRTFVLHSLTQLNMVTVDLRGVLAVLWAASCCFTASCAAHVLSHGHLHNTQRHKQRTVDTTFAGISMFSNGSLSSFGLTSACEQALYQNILCDDAVSSLSTDTYVGSFDNSTLTALVCDAGCEASIAQLHDAVAAGCGTTAGLVPGLPFLGLVDQLWSNWNQSCFTDPTTGENCNGESRPSLVQDGEC